MHDGDAVADVFHDPQVVRDEEVGQLELALEVLEQVDDLRLNRHVQGRNGLVGDDEVRVDRERPRETDSLPLAARKLMRIRLGAPLRVGVVNREREATPETPTWNVVIVTTGIARRWFQAGLITAHDILVVDEIHQTSVEGRHGTPGDVAIDAAGVVLTWLLFRARERRAA